MTTALPPSEVTIHPHTIRIDTSEDARDHCIADSSRGLSYPDRNLIELDTTLDESNLRETTLHELLHMVFRNAGVHTTVDPELEEQIIAAITPRLLDMLQSNPDLVGYLIDSSAVPIIELGQVGQRTIPGEDS